MLQFYASMNHETELKNLTEEVELLSREISDWAKVTGLQNEQIVKGIESMRFSLESFYFLLWGSFLAIILNLITNIIHPIFIKYGVVYYAVLATLLVLAIYGVRMMISKKWKRILKHNPILEKALENPEIYFSKGLEKGNEFIQKNQQLQQRIDCLAKSVTKISDK